MAKSTKKTVRKTYKSSLKAETTMPVVMPAIESAPVARAKARLNSKLLTMALIVVGIGLLTYKIGPWLVPSVVGTTPVTRFAVWSRMEKSYGQQTLDDLVNEKILDAAIVKSGVKVEQAKIDAQMKTLEDQFKDLGGLDEALKQRGLSRAELTKQVVTQLSVEEILKDKIIPTADEVKKQFDDNSKTLYKDKKFEDVQDSITDELKQGKLRDAFLTWFADVKKDAKIKSFGL